MRISCTRPLTLLRSVGAACTRLSTLANTRRTVRSWLMRIRGRRAWAQRRAALGAAWPMRQLTSPLLSSLPPPCRPPRPNATMMAEARSTKCEADSAEKARCHFLSLRRLFANKDGASWQESRARECQVPSGSCKRGRPQVRFASAPLFCSGATRRKNQQAVDSIRATSCENERNRGRSGDPSAHATLSRHSSREANVFSITAFNGNFLHRIQAIAPILPSMAPADYDRT